MFKNLRESIGFLNEDIQFHIVKNMIFSMRLGDPEAYQALVESGFRPDFVFDYKNACKVLGKTEVDNWIKTGTYRDNGHPCYGMNLDHWHTPEKRAKFLAQYSNFYRSGTLGGVLHMNFTYEEIENEVERQNCLMGHAVSH